MTIYTTSQLLARHRLHLEHIKQELRFIIDKVANYEDSFCLYFDSQYEEISISGHKFKASEALKKLSPTLYDYDLCSYYRTLSHKKKLNILQRTNKEAYAEWKCLNLDKMDTEARILKFEKEISNEKQ